MISKSLLSLKTPCIPTRYLTTKTKTSPAASSIPFPDCDYQCPPYEGPSYQKVTDLRKTHLTPAISSYYKKPLLINSGYKQWLYDETGRRYLDMFAGIVTVSVGHCHPRINEALAKQMKTLWHTTNIYMHPKIHEYAERLTAKKRTNWDFTLNMFDENILSHLTRFTCKFPGDLKSVHFVNSGSEANDLAMLLARLHTGNQEILTFRNAYHGMSPYTMGLTAHSTWRFPLPGVNSGIQHVMNPDPYQGIWGGSNCRDSPIQTSRQCGCTSGCEAGENYYNELEQTFKFCLPRGKVAAMFAESIQGVGGTVQYPKNFIKKAADLVRANGGLFVSDEVQTGFGRTGDHFWGFESHGIVPDIVTMAKGIGNGFPMAAVVTTPKIAECLNQALHFNTYGGNPLASTVGISVLDIIEDEGLQRNSLDVGTYFLKGLADLRDRYDIIGDVRGKGLMIGVELVADKEKRTPLSVPHVLEIWENCKDMGVLFGRGGINGNVFRIKPPMCITKADVDYAVDVFDRALSETKLN